MGPYAGPGNARDTGHQYTPVTARVTSISLAGTGKLPGPCHAHILGRDRHTRAGAGYGWDMVRDMAGTVNIPDTFPFRGYGPDS